MNPFFIELFEPQKTQKLIFENETFAKDKIFVFFIEHNIK